MAKREYRVVLAVEQTIPRDTPQEAEAEAIRLVEKADYALWYPRVLRRIRVVEAE